MRTIVSKAIALVAGASGIAAGTAELAQRHAETIEAVGWWVAGLAIATLALVNGRLGRRLLARRKAIEDGAVMIELAEQLAEFGRWRRCEDGQEEFSDGLCRLAGFPAGCMPDVATRREMLPDGGATFDRALDTTRSEQGTYWFEFDIVRVDGSPRTLRIVARNRFDDQGRLTERFGVAIDVTDRVRRMEALAREKNEAIAAAQEASRLAETDPLTGLANRRRAMADVDRAALTSVKNGDPLALIVFDIDHFKAVNDRFGHPAGDATLVRVAQIAQGIVRKGDTIGRIGGEEFLWALPGADLAVARSGAERLRSAIAQAAAAGGAPAVTVSVGVAGWRKGDSALALFARADAALYEAKRAGRDCVRRAA